MPWASDYKIAIVDVDGDEAPDVAGHKGSSGDVRVALQIDDGLLAPSTSWATVPANQDVVFADVNGDTVGDLTTRDRATGEVGLRRATDTTFEPPQSAGQWSPATALESFDVDGDGLGDLVGADALGSVQAAISSAPPPSLPAVPAPGPGESDAAAATPALPVPTQPDPLPTPEQCPPSRTDTVGRHNGMYLAFQDDRALLNRFGLTDNGNQTDAVCRINRLYDRMRQAGASIVRFNAYWGWIENAPDGNNQYPNGRYYWDQIDQAVDLARANGFRVHLTISGAAVRRPTSESLDCGGSNPNALGCVQPTGENPNPAAYREFVRQVVNHFTHDANGTPLVRAQVFSLWNEPNDMGSGAKGGTFLSPSGPERRNRLIPADLYGRLYGAGYLGYLEGLAGVTGTRVLIGELSSGSVRARVPGGSCSNPTVSPGERVYDPVQFLERSVKCASEYLVQERASATVIADGFALHPYEHYVAPWRHRPKSRDTGINRLGRVKERLCGPTFNGSCTHPLMSRQDGGTPELYLTEFGYFNRPNVERGKANPKTFHRETTRASWYSRNKPCGSDTGVGALRQALCRKAAVMLIYHLQEFQPPNRSATTWDSGLVGEMKSYPTGDGDIIGCRNYGKNRNGRNWDIGNCPSPGQRPAGPAQYRKAYCAIRRWAAVAGSLDRRDPAYRNACGP